MMVPLALLIFPGNTALNDEGIVKLRSNVSDSSAILSLLIGTLIVVLFVPAGKVAVIKVEI